MRGFIVLSFVALAVASPQGYNYPLSSNQKLSYGHQQILSQQPSLVPVPQFQQNIQLPSTSYGVTQQQVSPKADVRITKRFFIHSAPEEVEEEYKEKHLTVGTPSKNFNVVFIKAPSKSAKKHSIKIHPAVNEDKTVIYVLSKKTDGPEIDAQVLEPASTTTKPEVYFVKYRTPEEAAHAQEKIQAEYDKLGGSSQVLNEGISPVTSVIGAVEQKIKQQQQQEEQHELEQQLSVGSNNLRESSFTSIAGSGVPTSGAGYSNNGYLPPNYYF